MTKILLLIPLLSFIFTTALAQTPDSKVIAFNAEQYADKIVVSFTILAGNQCYGVVLEHATDSINFRPIYTFPGICGSSGQNEIYSYSHKDMNHNAINYYRLNLGGTSYTRFVAAYYRDYDNNNYLIYPVPVTNDSKLYFKNEAHKLFLFELINLEGKVIITKQINALDVIDIGNLSIKSGNYLFKLTTTDGIKITGKFTIL